MSSVVRLFLSDLNCDNASYDFLSCIHHQSFRLIIQTKRCLLLAILVIEREKRIKLKLSNDAAQWSLLLLIFSVVLELIICYSQIK